MSSKGLIENADESTSNWMRYVNYTNDPEERNLETFQYDGNLYYKTTKHVELGQELLLYHDSPPDSEGFIIPKTSNTVSVLGCHFCGSAMVKEEKEMEIEVKQEQNETEKKALLENCYECQYCQVAVMSEKILKYHEAQCRSTFQQMQQR